MESYVALLRAVNLAGAHQIRMAELKELFLERGFADVESLLQSGNIAFRAEATPEEELERGLEQAVAQRFGLVTEIFVRHAADLRRVVQGNPFPAEAKLDPAHLTVAFLKEAPGPEEWLALRSAIRGPERVEGSGRHGYIVYPDGIGRSHLTPAIIERTLGTPATSRNWNTVTRLDQLAGRAEPVSDTRPNVRPAAERPAPRRARHWKSEGKPA